MSFRTHLIFAILLLPLSAGAAVRVTRSKAGRIELLHPSCAVLEAQAQAIAQWRRSLGEVSTASDLHSSPPGCANGRLDITDLVPSAVRALQSQPLRCDGPNCFNAALFLQGIVPGLRYVDEKEVAFWLESPLCRALDASEPALPGDLVRIRQGNREIHGFVYVSAELAFEKPGYQGSDRYGLASVSGTLAGYKVGAACARVSESERGRCERSAVYYRCEPYARYLERTPVAANPAFQDVFRKVIDAECQVHSWIVGPEPLSPASAIEDLQRVYFFLDIQTDSGVRAARGPDAGTERFLWRSLAIRLSGLLETMRNLESRARF